MQAKTRKQVGKTLLQIHFQNELELIIIHLSK